MKLLCSLFLFFSIGAQSICSQTTKEKVNRGRDPQANGVVKKDKSKTLWSGKKTFVSVNFTRSRNLGTAANTEFLSRTSSYSFPIFYGVKLGNKWSAETGPFIGLNRNTYQRPGLLKEAAPMAATTNFSYGFMLGTSRILSDRLSLQFRYRKDFSNSLQAWQPIELGWKLSF